MGAITFRDLAARFGSAERAWDVMERTPNSEEAFQKAGDVINLAVASRARLLFPDEAEYPASLLDLPDPPPRLFAIGDLRVLDAPCVAIVGTRRATAYGERVTREIAGALARAGATVISGLARGIDGTAHRAALAVPEGGHTVAVLGTGVDIAYPAAHRPLHAEIASRGLLLSEELPGDRAGPGSFPKRNRIIAGLASVTMVVEAGARSGALITAGHALDFGRTVAAVPGPVDSPQSAGSNELIRDGAVVICGVADALAVMGLTQPARREPDLKSAAERALWSALEDGALTVDEAAARASLPARECLAAITALEIAGAIECFLTGEIARRG